MRRSIGVMLLSALFALAGVEALWEASAMVFQPGENPLPLSWLQLFAGSLALLTAIGAWRRAAWAPWSALLYGAVTTCMLLLLPSLLDLPREAASGIATGAAMVFLFAALSAWYFRRQALPGAHTA